MAKITVLGAGGWGTALAVMAAGEGHTVTLWSPFEEEIAAIRRDEEHKKLLPGVPVPPAVALTTGIGAAAKADLCILATPSFAVGETAEKLRGVLPEGALLTCVAKGIDEQALRRFSEVIGERLPGVRVTALSGPSHAEEVARGVPTSVVSASTDLDAARAVQGILMNRRFRIYITEDIIGVELGGALKNVIALAAGICDGLHMGDNTKAALMTRGLAEIARLGVAMGAHPNTFAGLSGMGDLIVTCGSMHSRNRRAGILIGQGVSPAQAVAQVGTVEGYLATRTARRLAERQGVELPITEQCYRVCYEGMSPREALGALMERPGRHERERGWL